MAGEVGLPVYLYNMPALTSVNISPELTAKLADRENIAGYKDSSGDLAAFRRAVKLLGGRPDFSLLIGPEHLTLPALQMGGTAASTAEPISVRNFLPRSSGQ
ncbi:MAG: dihydrodipicolinate synthase family protein [Lentisphaeria bacterium]|nr:MAG: dihydrodipicolinate synthase family protein [Lentisphaeria bacterium]